MKNILKIITLNKIMLVEMFSWNNVIFEWKKLLLIFKSISNILWVLGLIL